MRDVYKCVVCGAYVESAVHCGRRAKLLMSGLQRVRLSKLMSFLLRHDPSAAKLRMDSEGWVRIEDLVRGIREFWVNKEAYSWVTEEHVRAVALLDPKGRFEVRGNLIRARYGHSRGVSVSIRYEIDQESKVLYHGTVASCVSDILKYGIKSMRRHYVHLTTDPEVACETGARHGNVPVYLVINADCLRKCGHKVLVASNVIRLTDYVPPKCIENIVRCSK